MIFLIITKYSGDQGERKGIWHVWVRKELHTGFRWGN